MQTFERVSSETQNFQSNTGAYGQSVRGRIFCASLTLAVSVPVTSVGALANVPLPQPVNVPHTGMSHLSNFHQSIVQPHSVQSLVAPFHTSAGHLPQPTAHLGVVHGAPTGKNLVQAIANSIGGLQDLNLGSAATLYSGKGLAGFTTLTLDIGGHRQTVNLDSKLTAAELVAAQQVLSGGKQLIRINSSGVATGGSFNVNGASVSALDSALGGNLNSLVVSRGVRVVDTMSNFDLTGSLVNLGTVSLASTAGASGNTVNTISAANIYNGLGASIVSAGQGGGLSPAGIALNATGLFYNNGVVSSSSTLNISAPTISNVYAGGTVPGAHNQPVLMAHGDVNLTGRSVVNAGVIASSAGNINFMNGGGNNSILLNNNGGTVQALSGNINFNQADNIGTGNVTLQGGNWYSQQLNLNAGQGTINADLGQVSGDINGVAGCSHLTAATDSLRVGNLTVSGDPTIFNTAGDILIDGSVKATTGTDLALIASGNIIAAGGQLDTSSGTTGGSLLLVAGANITSTKGGVVTLDNSSNKFQGSATGGFIDLSGITLTKTASAPITKIDSSGGTGAGGDITMIAYQGSAKNSGDIAGTTNPIVQPPTAGNTINAGTGKVTLIGGGGSIFAQNIGASAVTISGNAPTIVGGPIDVTNGTQTGGTFAANTKATTTATLVVLATVQAPGGAIKIDTFGDVFADALISAGVGGVAGGSINGQSGGNISVNAGQMNVGLVDASGGGGAGGTTAGAAGGKGGDAGNIALTSSTGNIQINNGINASGGGGGGGAGSNTGAAGGLGGTGGKAGDVSLSSKLSIIGPVPPANPVSPPILVIAYAGGDGGQGGAGSGTNGGGGGGGGGAAGGGGGGGAAAIVGSGLSGGGGGGGGTGGGGGAGGTDGSASATGGGGGSSSASSTLGIGGGYTGGAGGTGSAKASGIDGDGGLNPFGNGGSGGSPSSTDPAPALGGQYLYGGTGGGVLSSSGAAAGIVGNNANIGTGGNVTISVGASSGSTAAPLFIDAGSISVNSTAKSGNLVVGCFDNPVILSTGTMFTGTSLTVLSPFAGITINGALTGGATVTLNAGGGDISGAGNVTATTVNLIASNGNITGVNVGANNLAANASGNAQVNLISTAGKITNIQASSVGSGNSFSILSPQEINVVGTITATDGTVLLAENGTTSLIGINTGATISTGANGTVQLKTGGTGSIINSKLISAKNIIIDATGAVGSASKPLLTSTGSLMTITGHGGNSIYIKDSALTTAEFTGSNSLGGSISLITAAQNIKIDDMNFGNVSIQSTYAGTKAVGTLTLGKLLGDKIGDGLGVVSITAANSSVIAGFVSTTIAGTNVTVTSKGGDVGDASGLKLDAPVATLSAVKGQVNVADAQSAVLNAGTARNAYNFTAPSLTVAGAISGATILLKSSTNSVTLNANVGTSKTTTVAINGNTGISQKAKVVVTGTSIDLSSTAGDIGNNIQPIVEKASNLFTVLSNSSPVQVFVNQTGKAALGSTQLFAGGKLSIVDTNPLTINNTVTSSSLSIVAPAVSLVTAGGKSPTIGSITTSSLNIVTNNLTLAKSTTITSSIATTFGSNGALSISGTGKMNLSGTLNLGTAAAPGVKGTSSITLGDAKTGANSPLASQFSKLTFVAINGTGNFSSTLDGNHSITLNSTSDGGLLAIQVANIVDLNNTSLTPISLSANGASGMSNGIVVLKLTGTQPVTIATKAVDKTAPYVLTVNSGGGTDGLISVDAAGTLNVVAGGIKNGTKADMILSGGKGLLVDNILNGTLNLVSLVSGSTAPFVINDPASKNGTIGQVNANQISITANGTITTNSKDSVTSTGSSAYFNPTGTLIMVGVAGSINTGSLLTLTGAKGVTLGDAKTGANNPIPNLGDHTTNGLIGLTIEAGKGNFTAALKTNEIGLDESGHGGNLIIDAVNIVNIGSTSNVPIVLSANGAVGSQAGGVSLTLTGTQAVTLDSNTPSSSKSPAPYVLQAKGTGAGIINVTVNGTLTENAGGIVSTSTLLQLSLTGGKGLAINDSALMNGGSSNLILASKASNPLVFGAASVAPGSNAIVGDVLADSVTLQCLTGITVNQGHSIGVTGNGAFEIDTKNFINNGAVNAGSVSTLLLFNVNSIASKIGTTFTTGATGTYSNNFSGLSIIADGAVGLNNLLASSNFGGGKLSNILINTTGAITLDPVSPSISVANDGQIFITGASLTSKASTAITVNALGNSVVYFALKSDLTLGGSKGNLDLSMLPNTSTLTANSAGKLTINQALTTSIGFYRGDSIIDTQPVTAIGFSPSALSVLSTGKSGAITTTGSGAFISTNGPIAIATANTKLSKTATTIKGLVVQLGAAGLNGALNLNNQSSKSVTLTANTSIAALTHTAAIDTVIDSITTTAGGINISASGGNSTVTLLPGAVLSATGGGVTLALTDPLAGELHIGAGSSILTSGGNITLQNLGTVGALGSTIKFDTGVTVHSSATAKGVGQVSIVLGAVPAKGLTLGTVPTPAPTVLTSGGAGVTYTTTARPNGTITTAGTVVLNAAGRNVVFNENGLAGSIMLADQDVIIADPPIGPVTALPNSGLQANVSQQSLPTPGVSHLAPTIFVAPVGIGQPVFSSNSIAGVSTLNSFDSTIAPGSPTLAASISPISVSGMADSSAVVVTRDLRDAAAADSTLTGGVTSTRFVHTSDVDLHKRHSAVDIQYLEHGPLFLAPKSDTSVKVGDGSVHVAANAVVLIVAFDGGVAVYNLHDNQHDSVVINLGGHRVALTPGRNAVITRRNVHGFEEVNPAEFVGYRKLVSQEHSDGYKTYQSEFHVPTMLAGLPPLKQLLRSNDQRDRRVASALLKTTAILISISDSTPYSLMRSAQLATLVSQNTQTSQNLQNPSH